MNFKGKKIIGMYSSKGLLSLTHRVGKTGQETFDFFGFPESWTLGNKLEAVEKGEYKEDGKNKYKYTIL